ncbi:hypothetical protein AA313_de0204311 [Arthrobotrys entomopaga]|nr:hypothetical protein AA313_de0204311 [Arthrobotrys entomopaga]
MASNVKDSLFTSSSTEGDDDENEDVESEPDSSDESSSDDAESSEKNSEEPDGSQDNSHIGPSVLPSVPRDGPQFNLRMLLQATSTEHQIREHLTRPEYNNRTPEEKQRIVDRSLKKMAEFGALDPKVLEFGGKAYETHRNAVRGYMASLVKAVSADSSESQALEIGISGLQLGAPRGFQLQIPRMGLEAAESQGPGNSAIFGPRWEEVECLGKGGFGSVWACKNLLDEEVYAIKKIIITDQFLKAAKITDEKRREKAFAGLHHEVRILARLDHPNIVRYYSSWMERMSQEEFEEIKDQICPDGLSEYTEDSQSSPDDSGDEDDEYSTGRMSRDSRDDEVSGKMFQSQDSSNSGRSASTSSILASNMLSLDISNTRKAKTHVSGVNFFETSSNLSLNSESSSDLEIVPRSSPHPSLPTAEQETRVHILSIQMAKYSLSLDEFIKTPNDNETSSKDLGIDYNFHPRIAVKLMLRIVDGVEYMHHFHLIHRDLKPANIFLKLETGKISGQQGSVIVSGCKCHQRGQKCPQNGSCLPGELCSVTPKIGDFGLTADIRRILEHTNENRVNKISLENPIAGGTAFYMPPAWSEKSSGIKKHRRTSAGTQSNDLHLGDAYALGIIFFELLQPFKTNVQRQIEIGKLREDPRPEDPFPKDFILAYSSSLNPNTIPSLKSMILRLTCEKGSRMGVSELKHKLEELLESF